MPKNHLKEARHKKGFTQQQLAKLVGTSQQQIQRIEAGVQTARLHLAMGIAHALGASLEQIFPSSKKAIKALRARKDADQAFDDDKLSAEFESAGIDLDPRVWTFKYKLRNGLTGSYTVSSAEKDRLWSAVQERGGDMPFVVFDTLTAVIAINRQHLIFSHFLFDPPFKKVNEKRVDKLVVYTSCDKERLEFGIDPDGHKISEEHEADEDTQLQNLVFYIESAFVHDVIDFDDEDGETAFFPVADIAMVIIPLWAIEPELLDSEIDALEENDTGDSREEEEDKEE